MIASISDCFRMKASSTLQKRTGSLWRLKKLLRGGGILNPLRITEQQLYLALCELRECGAGHVSPTHAGGFVFLGLQGTADPH